MSETLSQDPETLSSGYTLAPSYPATSSSDPNGSNLPPFQTFADMDATAHYNYADSRFLDWEYCTETRLLERTENGLSIMTSQPQYRPWESKPIDSNPTVTTFADAFAQNPGAKLPSFQSQFHTFNDPVTTTEPTLTTLTPVSPNVTSPSLTTLGANFHTLNTARNYPLVPAPIQAREIPSIQQQFLDERHIQLYTHPTTFPPQNGTLIQNINPPTVVTVLKSEPDLKLSALHEQGIKFQNVTLHATQFQNPMPTIIHDNSGLYNGLDKKLNGINASMGSPTRSDFRKKERRKMRASSLESSAESDGASSNMEIGSENSGQVAAVSSTASFKHHSIGNNSLDVDDCGGGGGGADKQVKKKRKRCGECIGCQRKDNCGDCAPCRNDKSHQICKQRRCEKLTEKKNLYGDPGYARGESRRGRGKGRGAGSYRGRKPSGPVITNSAVPESTVPSSRPSPQPVHMIKQEPVQQQPMAPMSFYPDPNRFPTPVWQAADPTQGWPQGQFIQQITPAQPQATIETYTQQYPNGIYQATYQQPAFETNTFYTGAVQVLTNTRPPSVPNQQLTPRANGSYTPSPSPVQQSQQQQQSQAPTSNQQPQSNTSRNTMTPQYQEYVNQNYAPAETPPNTGETVISRPSSVNSNAPTPVQSYQQPNGAFTSANFSPSSNSGPNYVNASSGNERPGYPQVSSNPPLVSHNSSGYPGQYGGNNLPASPQQNEQHWTNADNIIWEQNQLPMSDNSIKQEQVQYDNEDNRHDPNDQFNQAHRVNINSRIKSMILNKQDKKLEEVQKDEHNKTGHFLWFSHHRRLDYNSGGGGDPSGLPSRQLRTPLPHIDQIKPFVPKFFNTPHRNNIKDALVNFVQKRPEAFIHPSEFPKKQVNVQVNEDKVKNNVGNEIPKCECFPSDNFPPEPGSYYTHLGCSNDLVNLRKDLENRTGVIGNAIRIEKVCYTGKEGKTSQGCPIAKWIIRRSSCEEKYLIIVKQRRGHICFSAFIVVCIVAWDGVAKPTADTLYRTLTEKLNKFGLPTTRRCATNEQRTCACQGLNPDKCGASYSFGCSWSMFYSGCKFARSKTVRKFRLNSVSEEIILEQKLQSLATELTPLYKTLAPVSFNNQCKFEKTAVDCRLGWMEGRPFSGVTACVDFCAHAHKDLQNMNNGCTVVVSLVKERNMENNDEQLHVLPLYKVDNTDEFGFSQQHKIQNGSIEVLNRYQCEVRVRAVPLEPCRRKKRAKDTEDSPVKTGKSPQKLELQINQISSTVNSYNPVLNQSNFHTAFNLTYPYGQPYSYNYTPQYNNYNLNNQYTQQDNNDIYMNHKVQDSYSGLNSTTKLLTNQVNYEETYKLCNPFDDLPQMNYYSQSSNNSVINTNNIGQAKEVCDNLEMFRDPTIGGVAIALSHGSVLFECAKYELHATTALKNPDRLNPTRISLVFYQHRNLNKSRHGWDEYEKKVRMKKLSLGSIGNYDKELLLRSPTLTTMSFTTLFPMQPCIITGPYQTTQRYG